MNFKLIFALLLILSGILIILDKLTLFTMSGIFTQWWPLLIVFYGLSFFKKNSFKEAIFITTIGLLFLMSNLSYINFKWYQMIFPAILIFIGLRMLNFKTFKTSKHLSTTRLDNVSVMSGFSSNINSNNFEGGSVTTIMGSAEINLSEASTGKEIIYLELTTIMGGIDVKLPKNWKVEVTAIPILGGIDYKGNTDNLQDFDTILKINAFCIFGGIDINY